MKNVMKKWKKTSISLMLVLTFLLLVGCGRKNETVTSEIVTESVSQTITIEEPILEKAPEGYVYDYQVSMEPIPEDVAAFGGEVCGTIHAYPTKIKVEMMRRELEKPENAELKKEADRCAEEIVEALEKEYGGEFTAELMEINDEFWSFNCNKLNHKYNFSIVYKNYGYYNPALKKDNSFEMDTYLYDINDRQTYVEKIVDNIYSNSCKRVFSQKLGNTQLTSIYIAIFQECNIDIQTEQKKFTGLFAKLSEKYKEDDFVVKIHYFPVEYRNVIDEKCNSGSYKDVGIGAGKRLEEQTEKLIHNNEILGEFYLHEDIHGDFEEYYNSIEKNEDIMWKYWRLGGKN